MDTEIQELIIKILDDTDFAPNPNNLIPVTITEENGTVFKFNTTREAKLFKQLLGETYKGIVVKNKTVTINTLYKKECNVRQLVEFIRYFLCLENNMQFIEYKELVNE